MSKFQGPPHAGEDMIDFACSDAYRDHFAAQGLTYSAGRRTPKPRLPLVSRDRLVEQVDQLRGQVDEQKEAITQLRLEVEALELAIQKNLIWAWRSGMSPTEPSPSGRDLNVLPDLDGYTFTWRQWGLRCTVARLHEQSGNLYAELTVWVRMQGKDRLLTQGRVNLSALQTRERLVKRLGGLLANGPEWNTVVETVCVRTVALHREGQPAESLEPTDTDEAACFVCNPLIYERHPTLIYGPGESGKSFFGLYVACLLASGGTSSNLAVAPGGHNILYLDWEMRAPEMRARVKQLRVGHPELTKAPLHRAMHLPLASCAAEIRREIHRLDIGVVVIDSLGPATGGEIERASDPVAFFNALNSLNVASLLIGHVAKPSDDEKTRTPYGSVYYYNLARSIFEVRLAAEPDSDQRTVALYHRKNNLGRRLPPMGYTLSITDARARFDPCDPAEEPELARGLTSRERIKRLLADHQLRTVQVIAESLDLDPKTARQTLNRYKGRDWMCVSAGGGRGNEAEWGTL